MKGRCSTVTRRSFPAAAETPIRDPSLATPPCASSRSSYADSMARRATSLTGNLPIPSPYPSDPNLVASLLPNVSPPSRTRSESLVHSPDHLTVAMEDIDAFDAVLSDKIRKFPADFLPLFETAASEVLASLRSKVAGETGEMEEPITGEVQVFLSSKESSVSMRSIGVGFVLIVSNPHLPS
ncbi:hypothetical protein BHE74_00037871 [Ensete ventricosum]|uniref:MCM N-terminal domain-containing protein n=1 Tax=Ensete ventricosum TaxID=4639 RepID=A0A445MBP6_ENSVE|nr:hypothetical protein BHE74_00037871 [Ensete ventricosum]RZR71682.1 hypothetical protein BHM03_00006354 [Ensete ventricosum]